MPKHVYFSGIGGAGLFALAQLALDLGYQVSGSDIEDSKHLDWLAKREVKLVNQQSKEAIAQLHQSQPIDWLVATSALPQGHAELEFAKEKNIKISKRDDFVQHLLEEKK